MASGSGASSAAPSNIATADIASEPVDSRSVRDPTATRLRRFVRKFTFGGRYVKSGGRDSLSSAPSTTSSDREATSSSSGTVNSPTASASTSTFDPPPTPSSTDAYQRTQMLGLTSVGSDAFLDDDSLEDVDDDEVERNYLKPFVLPSWAANLEPWIQDMSTRSTRGLPWQFTTSDGARRLIVRHPTKPDKLLVYHETRSLPRNDSSSADLTGSEHHQPTVPSRPSTLYPVFPSLTTSRSSTPSSHQSSRWGESVASTRSSNEFDFTRYAAANVVSMVYSGVSKELGPDAVDRGAIATSPSVFVRGASGGRINNKSPQNTFGQFSSRSSSYVEHSNSSTSVPLPSSRSMQLDDIHSDRRHRVRNEPNPLRQLQQMQTQPQ